MDISSPNELDILVFAKYPEKGRCKTRLAKDLGEVDALRIYQALLNHTLKVVANTPYRKILVVHPPEKVSSAHRWAPGMDFYMPQSQGDLGERIWAAIAQRFESGTKGIVIIGSDCPEISEDSLNSAFFGLRSHDVVLGPTTDGGYYLLGLKKGHESLFKNIPWSTELVLQNTLDILKFQFLSYLSLNTFSDVDTMDDFRRVSHLEPLKNLGIR